MGKRAIPRRGGAHLGGTIHCDQPNQKKESNIHLGKSGQRLKNTLGIRKRGKNPVESKKKTKKKGGTSLNEGKKPYLKVERKGSDENEDRSTRRMYEDAPDEKREAEGAWSKKERRGSAARNSGEKPGRGDAREDFLPRRRVGINNPGGRWEKCKGNPVNQKKSACTSGGRVTSGETTGGGLQRKKPRPERGGKTQQDYVE